MPSTRSPNILSRLDEIRALFDEGGVVCETPGADGGSPRISTLIQADGDMVTRVPEGVDVSDTVDQHVADVAAWFARTRQTLHYAYYGVVGSVSVVAAGVIAVIAGWWQALFGLIGGGLFRAARGMLARWGRDGLVPKAAGSAVAIAAAAVAWAAGRPVVAALLGLGLVIAVLVSVAGLLGGVLVRWRLGGR